MVEQAVWIENEWRALYDWRQSIFDKNGAQRKVWVVFCFEGVFEYFVRNLTGFLDSMLKKIF